MLLLFCLFHDFISVEATYTLNDFVLQHNTFAAFISGSPTTRSGFTTTFVYEQFLIDYRFYLRTNAQCRH
jgi:hypothetical protein